MDKENCTKRFSNFGEGEIVLLMNLEIYKTGGGVLTPVQISDWDIEIKDIIGVAATGLATTYDSDAYPSSSTMMSASVEHNYCGDNNVAFEVEVGEEVVTEDLAVEVDDQIVQMPEWKSWNPSLLKTPLSTSLRIPTQKRSIEPTADATCSKMPGNSIAATLTEPTDNARSYKQKKKTQLTQDCRLKINVLSEAKIDLVKIQKEAIIQEMTFTKQEHELKLQHLKEEHEMKMAKHKIEMDILLKQLG
ncbi:hypothetical protein FQR65_LT18225 [Abscondita terminalis]|nr:hypothetical protein FQR65_LT18225 [Abscondita terminalis]